MEDKKLNVEEIWNEIDKSHLNIKILMAGKTGVGKSSVINAILGEYVSQVAETNEPCTRCNVEVIWSSELGDIKITDVPGFGEAKAPLMDGDKDYIENIKQLALDAHLLLLVLRADDKAYEPESKFIELWEQDKELKKIPVIIVLNQIDRLAPMSDQNKQIWNLKNPTTKKELMIHSSIEYAKKIFPSYGYANRIFPLSAGESFGDSTYGVDELRKGVNEATSDILELIIDRQNMTREEKIKKLINRYSVAAGAAAIQPIPVVDSFIIAPIQIAMIIHLGKVYNIGITKSVAGGILNALGMSVAGNLIFLSLIKVIPIVGSALGPAIAYSLTYTSGLIVGELLNKNNLNPSKSELKQLAEKYKEEAKKATESYKKMQKEK